MAKTISVVRPSAVRTTSSQFEIMLNFMENNERLINGKLTSNFTVKDRTRLWDELTAMLNKQVNGATKVSDKWRKTWSDWKSTVRAKAAALKRRERKSGHGSQSEETFSFLELRLLKLLGLASFAGELGLVSIIDVRSLEDSATFTSTDEELQQIQIQEDDSVVPSLSSESITTTANAERLEDKTEHHTETVLTSISESNAPEIDEAKSTSDLVISLPMETENEALPVKSTLVNSHVPLILRTKTPPVVNSKPVEALNGKRKRSRQESTEEESSASFNINSECIVILMKEAVGVLKQIASANEDMALAQMRLAVAGGRKAAAAERMAAAAERKATAAERRATAAERRAEVAERKSTTEK